MLISLSSPFKGMQLLRYFYYYYYSSIWIHCSFFWNGRHLEQYTLLSSSIRRVARTLWVLLRQLMKNNCRMFPSTWNFPDLRVQRGRGISTGKKLSVLIKIKLIPLVTYCTVTQYPVIRYILVLLIIWTSFVLILLAVDFTQNARKNQHFCLQTVKSSFILYLHEKTQHYSLSYNNNFGTSNVAFQQ